MVRVDLSQPRSDYMAPHQGIEPCKRGLESLFRPATWDIWSRRQIVACINLITSEER